MRRLFVILLAVVLVPSIAAASWYRCAYDGVVRSSCCCATETHPHDAPSPDASVKAACCCKVTQTATRDQTVRVPPPTAPDTQPFVAAVVVQVTPISAPSRVAMFDLPRAQGAPPAPLFVRHCSLLL